ncbi:MAG TPA: TetR family transcriptional regulator [Polyangiaceae bacterium]|nr:TetR family transcriptional regulator [Polyangiaceae bacterium]
MAKAKRSSGREEGLSPERIVTAAIELLDDAGETGLTFRALAARLATGSGALYWHIGGKDELLVAATDAIVERALGDVRATTTPRSAIRTIALGVFDAVDAHPWVGAQLWRIPWETATRQIFERIGRHVQALGVRPSAQFTSASTLVNYIIGVSVQNAAQGRVLDPPMDRTRYLEAEAARWKELDVAEYPFTRKIASQLTKHDDRAEFLAGIELIIAGIASTL